MQAVLSDGEVLEDRLEVRAVESMAEAKKCLQGKVPHREETVKKGRGEKDY